MSTISSAGLSRLARRVTALLGCCLLPWGLASILLVGGGSSGIEPWRFLLAALWLASGVGLALRLPPGRRAAVPWMLGAVALAGFLCVRPSADRSWSEDQSRSPWAEIDGEQVTFHDVRNFRYRSPDDWDAAWYEASYDLGELRQAWYVVEHFAESEAIAHTLVSFRFADDRFLAFSVEVRKEQGESYSPVRGLFRQFELLYVVGDERDVLQLRTNHRPSRVRLHPIETSPDKLRAYFVDLVERVNGLHERPEFYNTLTSSCTTNLAAHLEAVSEHRVTFDKRIYLPGYSSELVWELGLTGAGLELDALIERDSVTPARAAAALDQDDYSLRIRGLR